MGYICGVMRGLVPLLSLNTKRIILSSGENEPEPRFRLVYSPAFYILKY